MSADALTLGRIKWACSEIKSDMESDVAAFDGRPVDGKTIAEIHANLAAAVSALAGMISELAA